MQVGWVSLFVLGISSSHICLTVYPYNLGKLDNVAKPPKRSLAERAAARARRVDPRARTPAPSTRPIDGRIFHSSWTSVQGATRVLCAFVARATSSADLTHPARAAETIQCVRWRLPRRTRRSYERDASIDHSKFPIIPFASTSSKTNASRSISTSSTRARSNKGLAAIGKERSAAAGSRTTRHGTSRDRSTSRESQRKKYAFKIAAAAAFVPCSHVNERSGAGWDRFGCGKVRRAQAAGRDVAADSHWVTTR